MNYTSVAFIFIFLPTVLLGLWILKKLRVKNNIISGYLLAASLVFYGWGGIGNLFIVLILSVLNYMVSIKLAGGGRRKYWLAVGIIINLSVLLGYKYTNFAVNSIRSLLSMEQVSLPIPAAPLGLSFFTFLSIAYLADVYRGRVQVQRNAIRYLEYVFFFPKVTMGPITRMETMQGDLCSHQISLDNVYYGMLRFCVGFIKKILLANQVAVVADAVFNAGEAVAMPLAWLGILSYSMQIYLDFSAYSDMAIGLGKIFGVTIIENFNYPYISQSIKEFWRRWHISLSTWFRDYVYIPLGGNQKGTLTTYRNLMVVFFLTGLWHGASWNFIVWGLYFGVFLLLERIGLERLLKKAPAAFRHFYALFVVMIGWVFFRADSLGAGLEYLKCMFGAASGSIENLAILKTLTPQYFFFLGVSFLACTPIAKVVGNKIKAPVVRDILILVLFFLSLCYMAASSYNPFIYTRF